MNPCRPLAGRLLLPHAPGLEPKKGYGMECSFKQKASTKTCFVISTASQGFHKNMLRDLYRFSPL